MRRAILAGLLCGTLASAAAYQANQGGWLSKVPESDRTRVNPLAEDSSAAQGGEQVFQQHCASCHGEDAKGIGRRPSLRTMRVHGATDGELQWLLRNGDLRYGMPAWANLPEVQRWQVVRFLHTLPVENAASKR